MLENIYLSKKLVSEVGLLPAFINCILQERSSQLNEWFVCPISELSVDLSYSRHKITKAIDKLIEKNIIEKKVKGLPAKTFIRYL